MRDKARIKIMLDKFETMWTLYPDLRFCQIVYNLTRDLNDIFNLEDGPFEKRIDEKIKTMLEQKERDNDNN